MSVIIGVFLWVVGVFIYLCVGAIVWRALCAIFKTNPQCRYWSSYTGRWRWNDGKAFLFGLNLALWPISWALLIGAFVLWVMLTNTFKIVLILGKAVEPK